MFSNFAKQMSRNRLQFVFWLACKICDGRALAMFYSSKSLSIKQQLRDAECPWEGHNHSIIQWPSTFDTLKTAVPCSPIEVDGWEGNRVSRPAISSWFWTNSPSRWTCSNAFLVNEMLTQQYIFDHLIFEILEEAELPLQRNRHCLRRCLFSIEYNTVLYCYH